MSLRRSLLALAALALVVSCGEAQTQLLSKQKDAESEVKKEEKTSGSVKVDKDLPVYKATAGVSGTIRSVGSDTMNNLMTAWGEGFKKYYPNVTLAIEGKGSSTAMPALEGGTATFGPMSRDPKPDEISSFQKKFGYKPTMIATSLDMLAVYVHRDNPVTGLTLPQVDAIFSATRKLGHRQEISTWGELGLKDDWVKEPISLYGRNAASGTYGYFKEHALGKGDFKDDVKVQPGSSGVIQAIAGDRFGIGYSGIGYATADVRAVPLAKEEGADFIAAESQNAYNGKYPMWRPLLLVVNRDPTKPLDPLRREFIKYVLSKQGQEDVVSDGYLPLPAKAAKKALSDAGIK